MEAVVRKTNYAVEIVRIMKYSKWMLKILDIIVIFDFFKLARCCKESRTFCLEVFQCLRGSTEVLAVFYFFNIETTFQNDKKKSEIVETIAEQQSTIMCIHLMDDIWTLI